MMRIASNLASISAQRSMGLTQRDLEKSMRALASGSRFADPAADSSGFAIAENVRSQIKGYEAAKYNSDNAVSFTQLAEGALNEQSNILIRLRELSVQAASDTIGDKEREYLNYEAKGLTQEFDRIAKSTSYGSQNLLDGSTKDYEFQVGIHNSSNDMIRYNHNTDTTASNLNVDDIDVSDKSDARSSLATVDKALVSINTARAKLGAVQSRMQIATDHIDAQIENLTDAHGRLNDVDIASEVTNVRKSQILLQYQAAMLQSANDSRGIVLKLLG